MGLFKRICRVFDNLLGIFGGKVGRMWGVERMLGGCGKNVDFVPINSPQILCPTIVQQHPHSGSSAIPQFTPHSSVEGPNQLP